MEQTTNITIIIYKPVTNVFDWYQASPKAKQDQLMRQCESFIIFEPVVGTAAEYRFALVHPPLNKERQKPDRVVGQLHLRDD